MASEEGAFSTEVPKVVPGQLVILSCGHQFRTTDDDRPESTHITFSPEHPKGEWVTTPKTTYHCIRCVKVVGIVKFGDTIKVLGNA